jgi:Ca-activated chloride channel family protein
VSADIDILPTLATSFMPRQKQILLSGLLIPFAFIYASSQRSIPHSAKESFQESTAPFPLTVSVSNDKGIFLGNLEQDRFTVLVDNVPAKVVSFSNRDEPASVGILFDASGSIDNPRYGATKLMILRDALSRFLELSSESNEYFVLGFNYRPQLLSDWTSDPKAILDRLVAVQPKGQTAFYDASYVGIDKVMHGRHAKRAIILISDGLDNQSKYTFKELRELVRESNVLVYSVNVLGGEIQTSLSEEGQAILNEISFISGGMTFYQNPGLRVQPANIRAIFEMIADVLHNQYTFGVLPISGDKKWHKIKVTLRVPPDAPREMKHLSVRTREGFYLHH